MKQIAFYTDNKGGYGYRENNGWIEGDRIFSKDGRSRQTIIKVVDATPENLREAKSMIEKDEPSLPSNLDEAAFDYAELCKYDGVDKLLCAEHFKAGATWRESQMKMPNSSELIAAWDEAKSVLREKDFRGDEWRLAYNAFMFGFSKGLNIKREK